jgi:hypothetical protein
MRATRISQSEIAQLATNGLQGINSCSRSPLSQSGLPLRLVYNKHPLPKLNLVSSARKIFCWEFFGRFKLEGVRVQIIMQLQCECRRCALKWPLGPSHELTRVTITQTTAPVAAVFGSRRSRAFAWWPIRRRRGMRVYLGRRSSAERSRAGSKRGSQVPNDAAAATRPPPAVDDSDVCIPCVKTQTDGSTERSLVETDRSASQ